MTKSKKQPFPFLKKILFFITSTRLLVWSDFSFSKNQTKIINLFLVSLRLHARPSLGEDWCGEF